MPGGSINLSKYLDVKDKFNVSVSEWAEEASPGHFRCKVCVPSKVLSFAKGKKDLTQHSESEKHRKNAGGNVNKQVKLTDCFEPKVGDEIQSKAQEFEIVLLASLASHGIHTSYVDCLVEILKKYAPDSDIIKKVALHKSKASYVVNNGMGDYYEKEMI